MRLNNVLLSCAGIACLCLSLPGAAAAQQKTTNKTITTANLVMDLSGTGKTPVAAAGVSRSAMTTAALPMNFGTAVKAPNSAVRQTFSTGDLVMNFGSTASAAVKSKSSQSFTVAALVMNFGQSSSSASSSKSSQSFSTAALVMNFASTAAPAAIKTSKAITTSPLPMNFGR